MLFVGVFDIYLQLVSEFMKTRLLLALVLALFVCALFAANAIRYAVKRMRTLDTIGQVSVAVSRTLGTNSLALDGYDVVMKARRLFPSIPLTNGQLADSWGHPLKVAIKRGEQGFDLRIVSSGPDGVFDSRDDLIENHFLPDESK